MRTTQVLTLAVLLTATAAPAFAAESDADSLAKQLSNPIANLITVPFQFNVDFGEGPDNEGQNYLLKFEPVIPVKLNDDWNVISRTIVPITGFNQVFPSNVFGLADIQQDFYFSPSKVGPDGFVWGVGPSINLPTSTDPRLGPDLWGGGPTGVALVSKGAWTVGTLATQTWSFDGANRPGELNQTFIQPFAAYALGGGQTLSLNSESTYDWIAHQWTVPINLDYTKVFHVGKQPMSFEIGGRYYAVRPADGPEWGIRTALTLLFPTGK
jgi:hypothetical protein